MARMTKRQQQFVDRLKGQVADLTYRINQAAESRDRAWQSKAAAEATARATLVQITAEKDAIIQRLRENIDIQVANQKVEAARADDNLQRSIETAVRTAISTTSEASGNGKPIVFTDAVKAEPVTAHMQRLEWERRMRP